ncbi:MAG: hypothetical protein ABEJ98_02120 [Candidatus Nanohaloarchaea archaeon]
MFVVFSHILAFATLFVGSVFDLKTTEVPDSVSVAGIVGGVLLHAAASFTGPADISVLGDLSLLFSQPLTWFSALGDPLLWSLGVGIVFSVYGWALYFSGMWGGADAFAMGVLGFGAPYAVTGPGLVHVADLFVNILLVGFVYTLGFAVYRAFLEGGVFQETLRRLKEDRRRVVAEGSVAAAVSFFGSYTGRFNGPLYFVLLASMIVLYRFLLVVQENSLSTEVDVSELEGGEVVESEDLDSKVKGITEEEVESLEGSVTVKEGVRFVPAFPVALLLTELTGIGVRWLVVLVS